MTDSSNKKQETAKNQTSKKTLVGFLLIILCDSIGSLLSSVLHLRVPGSVFGMLLLFLLLILKVIQLPTVESAARIFISLMLLFILPGGVRLMTIFDKFGGIIPQLLFISSLVAVLVIISSGWVTQRLVNLQQRKISKNFDHQKCQN